MVGRKKIDPVGGKKMFLTDDVVREAKKAFFSIMDGIDGDHESAITPEKVEKVVLACIGVLAFCRGFFVEPKQGANKKFYTFIQEVLDQIDVKPDQKEENLPE